MDRPRKRCEAEVGTGNTSVPLREGDDMSIHPSNDSVTHVDINF
jgi:hypothetical protein